MVSTLTQPEPTVAGLTAARNLDIGHTKLVQTMKIEFLPVIDVFP